MVSLSLNRLLSLSLWGLSGEKQKRRTKRRRKKNRKEEERRKNYKGEKGSGLSFLWL
jgi:hypothetical protein